MFLFEKGIEVDIEECITTGITLRNDYRDSYVHDMVSMLELDDGTQLGEGFQCGSISKRYIPNHY